MNQEEINSCKELHNDIDACITALIKARTEHNQEDEGKALFRMEGLMVAAQQQLAYFIDKPVPSDDQAARDYATFALRNRIGIPPDEAFKDGIAHERERLMKEAMEAELWRHNGRALKVSAVLPANSPIRLGDKVSVIIIKKEK